MTLPETQESADRTGRLGAYLAMAVGLAGPGVVAQADIVALTGLSIDAPTTTSDHLSIDISAALGYTIVYGTPFPSGVYDVGLTAGGGKAYLLSYSTSGSAPAFAGVDPPSVVFYPYLYAYGATIGPGSSFATATAVGIITEAGGGPYWDPGDSGYIGLKITKTGGLVYYGWIGLSIASDAYPTLTLTGFGFEDTPGTAILAGASAVPEPTSSGLGLLALGAAALGRWRRRSA